MFFLFFLVLFVFSLVFVGSIFFVCYRGCFFCDNDVDGGMIFLLVWWGVNYIKYY